MVGASVFPCPSLLEGSPLLPIEMMACGTACITSNPTAFPEFISADEGVMIDPGDREPLCAALVDLLTNDGLRRQVAAAGQKLAQSFTWEKTAWATPAVLMAYAR